MTLPPNYQHTQTRIHYHTPHGGPPSDGRPPSHPPPPYSRTANSAPSQHPSQLPPPPAPSNGPPGHYTQSTQRSQPALRLHYYTSDGLPPFFGRPPPPPAPAPAPAPGQQPQPKHPTQRLHYYTSDNLPPFQGRTPPPGPPRGPPPQPQPAAQHCIQQPPQAHGARLTGPVRPQGPPGSSPPGAPPPSWWEGGVGGNGVNGGVRCCGYRYR